MRVLDAADVKDVQALAFSPDGRSLAVGAYGRGLMVHDLAGTRPMIRLGPEGFPWRAVVGFAPNGAVVALTEDGRTQFDVETGTRLGVGPHDPDGPPAVVSFAGTDDGTQLVTAQSWHDGSRLTYWEATVGGWERRWFVADPGTMTDPAFCPSGERVAFIRAYSRGRWAGYRLDVREARSGETVGIGLYPYGQLDSLRYRPDGKQVVVAHATAIVVWDARVFGKPVLVRNDSRRHFTSATYHPSGRYLFTTSNDATVTVWDTENWVRVKRFAWDIGELRAVAVSPDGLLAAAGSDRGRVVVWDVDL